MHVIDERLLSQKRLLAKKKKMNNFFTEQKLKYELKTFSELPWQTRGQAGVDPTFMRVTL